jgi:hypothetical protein
LARSVSGPASSSKDDVEADPQAGAIVFENDEV